MDHIDYSGKLSKSLNCPASIHPLEKTTTLTTNEEASRILGHPTKLPPVPEVFIQIHSLNYANHISSLQIIDHKEGDVVTVGSAHGTIMLTVGHTPGSCSFYFPDEGFLFCGDTVYNKGFVFSFFLVLFQF